MELRRSKCYELYIIYAIADGLKESCIHRPRRSDPTLHRIIGANTLLTAGPVSLASSQRVIPFG